jgi:hypothetical protein
LLSGRGRVTLVNRTGEDEDVVIVAAAIVRHVDGADPHIDTVFALEVAAGQSVEIHAAPPLTEAPDAIEAVLRVRIGDQAIVDAYAIAQRNPADATGAVEFGLKENGGVLNEGESSVADFPEIAIYAVAAD